MQPNKRRLKNGFGGLICLLAISNLLLYTMVTLKQVSTSKMLNLM